MNVREPAIMSFIGLPFYSARSAPVGGFKKTVFFPGIFLRAVCCSGAPAGSGQFSRARIPAPGGSKRDALRTLAAKRPVAAAFVVFSSLRCEAQSEGAGVKAAQRRRSAAPSTARPGLDAGAPGDYIAWPPKEEKTPQQPAAAKRLPGFAPRITPARIRQESWCLRGKTGPVEGPGSTQPSEKSLGRRLFF